MRSHDRALAKDALDKAVALQLTESERDLLAGEFAHATEVVATLD